VRRQLADQPLQCSVARVSCRRRAQAVGDVPIGDPIPFGIESRRGLFVQEQEPGQIGPASSNIGASSACPSGLVPTMSSRSVNTTAGASETAVSATRGLVRSAGVCRRFLFSVLFVLTASTLRQGGGVCARPCQYPSQQGLPQVARREIQ
jgi:hypothetical protein